MSNTTSFRKMFLDTLRDSPELAIEYLEAAYTNYKQDNEIVYLEKAIQEIIAARHDKENMQ